MPTVACSTQSRSTARARADSHSEHSPKALNFTALPSPLAPIRDPESAFEIPLGPLGNLERSRLRILRHLRQIFEVDTSSEILEPGVNSPLIEFLHLTEDQAIQWRITPSRPRIWTSTSV
jgi:hypothetical protein